MRSKAVSLKRCDTLGEFEVMSRANGLALCCAVLIDWESRGAHSSFQNRRRIRAGNGVGSSGLVSAPGSCWCACLRSQFGLVIWVVIHAEVPIAEDTLDPRDLPPCRINIATYIRRTIRCAELGLLREKCV